MNTKHLFGILAIITLALIACDDGKDTHTHEWEWKVTTPATYDTGGLETETCKTCGATNGTRPKARLCGCNPKAHLGIAINGNVVPCDCGGSDCTNCEEQWDNIAGVAIRKENDVSVSDFISTVAKINLAYQNMAAIPGMQDALAERAGFVELLIILGDQVGLRFGGISGSYTTIGVDAAQEAVDSAVMGAASSQ